MTRFRSPSSPDPALRRVSRLVIAQLVLLALDFLLLGARSLAVPLGFDLSAQQALLDGLFLGGVIAAAALLVPLAWICIAPLPRRA